MRWRQYHVFGKVFALKSFLNWAPLMGSLLKQIISARARLVGRDREHRPCRRLSRVSFAPVHPAVCLRKRGKCSVVLPTVTVSQDFQRNYPFSRTVRCPTIVPRRFVLSHCSKMADGISLSPLRYASWQRVCPPTHVGTHGVPSSCRPSSASLLFVSSYSLQGDFHEA